MSSPNGYYNGTADQQEEYAVEEQLDHSFSSPKTAITRTVAFIKYHALDHRFDIERRIQEASFEIVKERQMEFDTETDPETLEELFGEDTHSLAEYDSNSCLKRVPSTHYNHRGPVWVYVLERRRAVEVWHTLMGPRDPEQAREEAPNSLRALYGTSLAQNGLMGAPDNETAEIQIASLFASSPPFPTSDLPPEDGEGSYNSLHGRNGYDEGYAPSNVTSPSTVNGSSTRFPSNGKPAFKARAVPASIGKPDIVPRMTKAAALRTGQPVAMTVSSPRKPVSKERQAQTFANVPGHRRSETITVASTAAPTIAPRMTRAAALRLGQTPAPQPTRTRSTENGPKKPTFEGVPGHKRRETISVASVQTPTVAPRLNKSASLRAQKDQAPPTSFMFKGATTPKTPGSLSRANSSDGASPARTRPASQTSFNQAKPQPAPAPRRPAPRASSVAAVRPTHDRSASATPSGARATKENGTSDPERAAPPAAKPRPRPSSICAPSIQPRTNKSAALRAAKKEAEAAAAAAALAKKAPKGVRAPPSSFKTIAT
ncbi:hypothetical protein EST38_g495 [Candolleomyces aberdarensis]|uniref:Nucleoside diphosphate kinase n=1 Tax=Candolleomyces aberdarensis TaxID=2316362 RepID=A0A4Q2DYH3_9AGAR|nr:hypothetical protein EST38_g495 [Candolleomyces aberdarensis]